MKAGSLFLSVLILTMIIFSTPMTVSAEEVPGKKLESITVTPVDPSIYCGENLQFTAIGTYSDGSTENMTGNVTWSKSTNFWVT